MLNMKEIIDYGPCYVVAINCPADGIDLLRKTTLFDINDAATHETINTLNTAQQAKKFARKYICDPKGTVQKMRMLSNDPVAHHRALWAVALLGNHSEHDIIITDKRKPNTTPKRYQVTDIFPTAAENLIVVRYYPSDEAINREFLYIGGIKAVKVIAENTFEFETYSGKTYIISGKD